MAHGSWFMAHGSSILREPFNLTGFIRSSYELFLYRHTAPAETGSQFTSQRLSDIMSG